MHFDCRGERLILGLRHASGNASCRVPQATCRGYQSGSSRRIAGLTTSDPCYGGDCRASFLSSSGATSGESIFGVCLAGSCIRSAVSDDVTWVRSASPATPTGICCRVNFCSQLSRRRSSVTTTLQNVLKSLFVFALRCQTPRGLRRILAMDIALFDIQADQSNRRAKLQVLLDQYATL